MKSPIVVCLLLLAAVGAGGGAVFWWWTVGSIPMPVRLCEERIKEMLKSSTSYQRANYNYIETPQVYNREDFINAKMEVDTQRFLNFLESSKHIIQ